MAKDKGKGAPASGNDETTVAPDSGKGVPAAIFVKKITAKTVLDLKVAKYAPKSADAEPVPLFAVYGVANGIKTGESDYGDYAGVTGVFEAVRYDGKRFQSGTCYLPGAAGEILISSLKVKREQDPEASIHFGVQISVKYAEKRDGTDGYEYVTSEVIKPEKADLLADMRAQIVGMVSFEGAPAAASE